MVSDLINEDSSTWNEPLVLNTFEEATSNEILAIDLNTHPEKDCLVWTRNKTGEYTVKSGYNGAPTPTKSEFIRASCSYTMPRSLWTRIWSISIPPKLWIFLWSLCQNAIPTRENLYRRRIIPEPLCPFCSTHMETTEHLFLLCKWTKPIWTDPRINIHCQPSNIRRFDIWLMEVFQGKQGLPEQELASTVFWNIWKSRNKFIFRAKPPQTADLVDLAQEHQRNFSRWQIRTKANPKIHNELGQWKPPEGDALKLNVDAS